MNEAKSTVGPSRYLGAFRRLAAHTELSIGTLILAALLVLSISAPLLALPDPQDNVLRDRLQPVGSAGHLLGTDQLGRDMAARLLAGLVWSLSAAAAATAISLVIGIILGLAAAAKEGWPRTLVRWSIDTIIALPGLVIAICIIAIIGQGWLPMVLTLGLLGWPIFARVVFAEALSLLTRNYVINARLQGVGEWAILFQHVAPGIRASLLTIVAFNWADMLIAESALSFLGIGAPLGAPTWGNMLAESRQYLLQAPWLVFAPGLAIILTVVAINLVGDGLARKFRGVERNAGE